MSFEGEQSLEKPEIAIHEASRDDNEDLLALMDDAEDHEYSLELQESGEGKYFVARAGNEIAGVVTLRNRMQSSHFEEIKGAFIQGLYIHPNHRREGAAGKLVEACEEEIRAKGGSELLLTVEANNEPAVRFYEGQGYKKIPGSDCGPDGPEVVGALSSPGYYMRKKLEEN